MAALSKTDPAARGLVRLERITRLELERKTLRDATRDTELLVEELDQHLLRLERAKKEWLRGQTANEVGRKKLMALETLARRGLEDQAADVAERLHVMEFLPGLRKLRAAPQLPKHRR
jgi:exonuclease VII small subunit